MRRSDEACDHCSGGTLTACEYPTRNVIRIQCAACGGTGLRKDDLRLIDAEKTAWARRLLAVAEKHERTGGPDEQQLAEWGRTS